MTKHAPKDKYICECGAKVTFIHKHMKRAGHQNYSKYIKSTELALKPLLRCECGMLVVRLTAHRHSAKHLKRMGKSHALTICICKATIRKFDMQTHLQSYNHCKNMINIDPVSAIDCIVKLGALRPQYTISEIDEIVMRGMQKGA